MDCSVALCGGGAARIAAKARLAYVAAVSVAAVLCIALFLWGVGAGAYGNNDDGGDYTSPTFVDAVKFVQYLDENTALEEVRGGNLDMYYSRIASDRLETAESRNGLGVYESTGGSYSILTNPAVSDAAFNPLQDRDVRFALNYLIDRRLVVNELMNGYGMPIISHYGPSDPEYLTVIEDLAAFDFEYNPALASRIISERLVAMGAVKNDDGIWTMNSEPVSLVFFIRSDDPVRKSIGEIIASELVRLGFEIKKEFGDLNKAFVVVYGSDPADLKWHLYTEGWAKSAFVRYDSAGLAQMYSPWFSNMPGFGDPSYWNYENGHLDLITQQIYTGNFTNADERSSLIKEAVSEGVSESVRIFLASKKDQFVTHESISGVINDFGAGLPSRFTPINARINSDLLHADDRGDAAGTSTGRDNELRVGVKQIYQGSWNPVMGFRDAYSSRIGTLLSDPATFKHPYTGMTIPVRATWNVTTAGPHMTLDMADDAVVWNHTSQTWDMVGANANATSVVVFEYKLGNWHHGIPMDMLDIMHSFYFKWEWGSPAGPDDVTSDAEYTSIMSPSVATIKGIKPLGHDTIAVYVDYWHFDEGEIAQWASPGASMPWEMIAAMEGIVSDGRASFSKSGSASKDTGWLSVIIPNDVALVRDYLESMRGMSHVPVALEQSLDVYEGVAAYAPGVHTEYYMSRYDAAISWIDDTGHALVGNGPFYLDTYSPESRSIRIISFDDPTYPFGRGAWSGFERAAFPLITGVDIAGHVVQRGDEMTIRAVTENADSVLYFVSSGNGTIVSSGTRDVAGENGMVEIAVAAADTRHLVSGANSLRLFALSEDVLRPDIYETGFLASGGLYSDEAVAGSTVNDDGNDIDVIRNNDGAGGSFVDEGDALTNEHAINDGDENWEDAGPNNAEPPLLQGMEDPENGLDIYYAMLAVGIVSIAMALLMRRLQKKRHPAT